MRELNVEELRKFLSTPRKISITTHHKPDGDAMGSSLGLYNYLLLKGHDVTVVTPNDYPEFLQWLPGVDKVIDFEKSPEKATELISSCEVLFCLDFNTTRRVEKFEPVLLLARGTKVLIDHHLSPESFCDYTYSYPDACATCELVYDFICSLGDRAHINKNVAECLYTGIMTDTGSFRFSTMKASTHRIIADLIEAGAENYKIHEAVYDNNTLDRLRLLGFCLKEKLKVLPELSTAYITVSRKELSEYNHQTGDTEGIVNYALAIKGVRLAAFFAERKDEVKISFRSKDNFSVKDLAEKHFMGGGHKNASGGRSNLSLEETARKFEEVLAQYRNELVANE
jgi:bifunctional oligoribonuclease and PAP phosphatase NrnA